MEARSAPSDPVRRERGEATREQLLHAAIEIFGRKGFEAGTRELAGAAGVNLAAIPYHFGSKEGLYLAAAEHISAEIGRRIAPTLAHARSAAGDGLDEAEARRLIQGILEALARIMVDDAAASWARFVIREQMDPSAAFERLYQGFIGPTFETLAHLVARITGGDPEEPAVRIQVPRLIGQVLVFRAARATVLRELRWTTIDEAEFTLIRDVIHASVAALGPPAKDAP